MFKNFPSGLSMSTILWFWYKSMMYTEERLNEKALWILKRACKRIINIENEKMKLLTNKERESYENTKICYIFLRKVKYEKIKKYRYNKKDKYAKDKKYF